MAMARRPIPAMRSPSHSAASGLPRRRWPSFLLLGFLLGILGSPEALPQNQTAPALEIAGVTVTPHQQSSNLRYRRPPEPGGLGARVELFLFHPGPGTLSLSPEYPIRFDGMTPAERVTRGDWAWQDTPGSRPGETRRLDPGTLTVWAFNTRGQEWGTNTDHRLQCGPPGDTLDFPLSIRPPGTLVSAVTFLGEGDALLPDRMVVHLENRAARPITPSRLRLWLPEDRSTYGVLHPRPWLAHLEPFGGHGRIPPARKGGFLVRTGPLPLTYAAVEVEIATEGTIREVVDREDRPPGPDSVWAHLRVKREKFDLGGGWVASAHAGGNMLQHEPYLRTLRRLHVSSGMHQHVPGYSDLPGRFEAYPLRYMNRLQPLEQYDTESMLPRIHAVEFLGEPQYGGGRPIPPQEVFSAFVPYATTRLPTSVTHSEERIWRFYAGLSDFPHFDAYRVSAPAPDAWSLYDRWGGPRLRWGAPLETLGDMTRSLRDLNRPRPVAAWSQGAHDGWDRYGGRTRTSPTPDELRAQAWQALAQRITSIYWFNLSLGSLVKFRDLLTPITRLNREILILQDFLLSGDDEQHRRESRNGIPDWDLASVAGPGGMLAVALDLGYTPDPEEKVFRFAPREGDFRFRLPAHLPRPAAVFRVDAEGTHDVAFRLQDEEVIVTDRVHVVGIYVVARDPGLRAGLSRRQATLLAEEAGLGFDPAGNDADFRVLEQLATSPPR